MAVKVKHRVSWKQFSHQSPKVARWRDDYGIDGIDLDLEEGAGSKKVKISFYGKYIVKFQPDLISPRLRDQTWCTLSEN